MIHEFLHQKLRVHDIFHPIAGLAGSNSVARARTRYEISIFYTYIHLTTPQQHGRPTERLADAQRNIGPLACAPSSRSDPMTPSDTQDYPLRTLSHRASGTHMPNIALQTPEAGPSRNRSQNGGGGKGKLRLSDAHDHEDMTAGESAALLGGAVDNDDDAQLGGSVRKLAVCLISTAYTYSNLLPLAVMTPRRVLPKRGTSRGPYRCSLPVS
jgi:hypothetical protein